MRLLALALLLVALLSARAAAEAVWTVDPRVPGPDLPPLGRSLFDHLLIHDGVYDLPFPFAALLQRIEEQLADDAYLGTPVKRVLIPFGRSLQRAAAAPDFLASPRAVIAVDGEPRAEPGAAGMLLRDRLYIGYMAAADVLEVISYNEAAGRFEFQVVHDYREHGTPVVSYASRALCTACHQNAAPIFARPLWDETNANEQVAQALRGRQGDFHGFPVTQSVDMAYAFDNATDRANGFALTQLLWRQGCGEDAPGRACRGALLRRALQFGLSGRRHDPAGAADDRLELLQRMRQLRDRLWPDGLLLPDPDIPNRKPLQRAAAGALPGVPTPGAAALSADSDVAAPFEPLAPRAPQALWNPPDAQWVQRAVQGLAQFLAQPDLDRLDAHLAAAEAPLRILTAPCIRRTAADGERARIKLRCESEELRLHGRLYTAADGSVSGRLAALQVGGDELGALQVAGSASSADGTLRLRLQRGTGRRSVRLADGNALGTLSLPGAAAGSDPAVAQLELRLDFAPVQAGIRALVAEPDGPLAGAAPQRAGLLAPLFARLGMPALDWCCDHDAPLPPARLDRPAAAVQVAALAPFYEACGQCHRTESPFPPNFLAGPPATVLARVSQCAARIRYRLGMWELDEAQRPKTPMPPQHALSGPDSSPERWAAGARLATLRQTLEVLLRGQGASPPPAEDLLTLDYADLPACLPDS